MSGYSPVRGVGVVYSGVHVRNDRAPVCLDVVADPEQRHWAGEIASGLVDPVRKRGCWQPRPAVSVQTLMKHDPPPTPAHPVCEGAQSVCSMAVMVAVAVGRYACGSGRGLLLTVVVAVLNHDRPRCQLGHQVVIRLHVAARAAARVVQLHCAEVLRRADTTMDDMPSSSHFGRRWHVKAG